MAKEITSPKKRSRAPKIEELVKTISETSGIDLDRLKALASKRQGPISDKEKEAPAKALVGLDINDALLLGALGYTKLVGISYVP